MKYIQEKNLKYIKLNQNNFYIVIDFDQTITSSTSQNSWQAIIGSGYIQEGHQKEHDKLYKKYKPIEIDNKLDIEYRKKAMEEWYSEIIDLFYKYENDNNIIEKSVKDSKLQLRNGAKEFFEKTASKDIPVIIISAGIGNTIKEFLKINNIKYNNIEIISNFIDFEKKQNCNYIHALNKSEAKWKENIINKVVTKDYAILLGDVIDDINMLPKEIENKKITIGFLDKNVEDNLELYKKNFDIVLTDDASFKEVEEILNI